MADQQSFVHVLVGEPAPVTLRHWAYQAMLASFSAEECANVWGEILTYLGFLDSLPSVREE